MARITEIARAVAAGTAKERRLTAERERELADDMIETAVAIVRGKGEAK